MKLKMFCNNLNGFMFFMSAGFILIAMDFYFFIKKIYFINVEI